MKKLFFYATLLIVMCNPVYELSSQEGNPKLVVGIIVDQMRFDMLYRYQEKFGQGGFNRLMREGYNFKNTMFNYVPTVTAAGHSSIYTGTTPAVHGIIGNSWYDRNQKQVISNVGDPNVSLVGAETESSSGYSPTNLISTTITDQLRIGSNFRSKVISVSLKDRGAILPGGRTANAAYWHDWENSPGNFVSSTYYMKEVPKWVEKFNKLGKTEAYLSESWQTAYDLDAYTESTPDDNNYERSIGGKSSPTFPYNFKEMEMAFEGRPGYHQLLWGSPAGNTIVKDFALEALKQESLGKDNITDMLCISFSAPDIAGHAFGPQSVEVEDIYIRLDKEIENLLETLDLEVGKGNYTLFLTSDHGVMQVASFLDDNRLQAGIALISKFKVDLEFYLNLKFGAFPWVERFEYENIYLDHKLIAEKKQSLEEIQRAVAEFMGKQNGVRHALTATDLKNQEFIQGIPALIQNGFHPKRSGDVLLAFEPGFIQSSDIRLKIPGVKGTTHGSGYAYDRHVPLLWFGKGISRGSSVRPVSVTDIAPTLSMMLNLQMPNGVSGEPLEELFR
ncbi:alkaline phosphatase PafA [Robiginitalea sp. IMCC44478]|uniref:alkaline phosphatase PafA n=1 Tax=Robiginitalea sp. IMCC44478 TaxID=3459122 RepID=UPI004042D2DE